MADQAIVDLGTPTQAGAALAQDSAPDPWLVTLQQIAAVAALNPKMTPSMHSAPRHTCWVEDD